MSSRLPLPPGPRRKLLLGNLTEFRKDQLAFYTRCAREYGDVVQYWFGRRRVVQINHPDLIEQVLIRNNRNFRRNFTHRLLEPFLGKGLVTSDGDFWLRQRRLAQPAFSRDRIASYAGAIVECCQQQIADWKTGDSRKLLQELMGLTLRIACRTLFGTSTPGEARDLGETFGRVQELFNTSFRMLAQLPKWIPTPHNLQMRRTMRELDAIVFRLIEQGRAGTAGTERNDLLSRLTQARDEDGGRMTDQQLRDELITFLLAGHETTALALFWLWYLLSKHPHVEQRLVEELNELLGDREPTAQDVPRLTYTDMVLRETMRLYPPAYGFGREAINSCELGGYRIPEGTTIFMIQWVVHRDPRFYDDPESFRPERWLPDAVSKRPDLSWFPFGAGPRVCIGNTFAMLEAILAIAVLARRFRLILATNQPVIPRPSITLRPRHDIEVVLESRG